MGCNDGAKNTLDYTYLSRAVDSGAKIRELSEVRRIEPSPTGGYRIMYRRHDPVDLRSKTSMSVVTADRLVIGAGTFGSTYLLLRNRAAFPALGPALGTRFSGNGDLLTFLRHSRRTVEGVEVPRPLDPEFGPVITSAIRLPDTLDGQGPVGRGFYVEDGGTPNFLTGSCRQLICQARALASAHSRCTAFGLTLGVILDRTLVVTFRSYSEAAYHHQRCYPCSPWAETYRTASCDSATVVSN